MALVCTCLFQINMKTNTTKLFLFYNDLQINITDVQVSQNGRFSSSLTRLYEQKHDKTSVSEFI